MASTEESLFDIMRNSYLKSRNVVELLCKVKSPAFKLLLEHLLKKNKAESWRRYFGFSSWNCLQSDFETYLAPHWNVKRLKNFV